MSFDKSHFPTLVTRDLRAFSGKPPLKQKAQCSSDVLVVLRSRKRGRSEIKGKATTRAVGKKHASTSDFESPPPRRVSLLGSLSQHPELYFRQSRPGRVLFSSGRQVICIDPYRLKGQVVTIPNLNHGVRGRTFPFIDRYDVDHRLYCFSCPARAYGWS
ncbi:hypothetical protein ACFE04_011190 [Oxalis oulophora]